LKEGEEGVFLGSYTLAGESARHGQKSLLNKSGESKIKMGYAPHRGDRRQSNEGLNMECSTHAGFRGRPGKKGTRLLNWQKNNGKRSTSTQSKEAQLKVQCKGEVGRLTVLMGNRTARRGELARHRDSPSDPLGGGWNWGREDLSSGGRRGDLTMVRKVGSGEGTRLKHFVRKRCQNRNKLTVAEVLRSDRH